MGIYAIQVFWKLSNADQKIWTVIAKLMEQGMDNG